MARSKLLLALAAIAVVAAVGADPVQAEGKGSDPTNFIVSARLSWWIAQVDGSFQVNQNDYEGSYADYKEDLDLSAYDPRDNPGMPSLMLTMKIMGSTITADWVESSMSGESYIEQMEFNGKEYVAENIRTDLDMRLYRLTYGHSLLANDFLAVSILGGVGYIDYRAEVTPEDPLLPSEATHTGGNAPFPYFGAHAILMPFDYFEAEAFFTWSRGDWGDARLLYIDATVYLRARPIKFVSIGLGFRFYHLYADAINVWSDDPDTLLITLAGPLLELEARF